MVLAFETSNSMPNNTPPPTPQLLLLSQQFHQLKYSNIISLLESSYGVHFKSNQKVLSIPINIHATITRVGKSFQASYYCSSRGLNLGKIDDYFSPLIVRTVPSRTIKARQLE